MWHRVVLGWLTLNKACIDLLPTWYVRHRMPCLSIQPPYLGVQANTSARLSGLTSHALVEALTAPGGLGFAPVDPDGTTLLCKTKVASGHRSEDAQSCSIAAFAIRQHELQLLSLIQHSHKEEKHKGSQRYKCVDLPFLLLNDEVGRSHEITTEI